MILRIGRTEVAGDSGATAVDQTRVVGGGSLRESGQGSRLASLQTVCRMEAAAFRRTTVSTPENTSQLYVERRANRRYPIDLAVQYEIGRPEEGVRIGHGRVVNISSGGVLIASAQPMPSGIRIRLRIEWPALLNNLVPLALHVEGRTVRAKGDFAALRIIKSEFRTRAFYPAAGAVRQAG